MKCPNLVHKNALGGGGEMKSTTIFKALEYKLSDLSS